MVGRKTMHLLALLAATAACGPAARPEPKGPTQAELDAQAEAEARRKAEAEERAKEQLMASPGMSRENAIEVCQPEGQRAYLSRLRCEGGSQPTVAGRSSVGLREPAGEGQDELIKAQFDRVPEPGEPHLHVVDRFEVDCGDGAEPLFVFLDMYHCPAQATSAVPLGLQLAAEGATADEPEGAQQPGGEAPDGDEEAEGDAESVGAPTGGQFAPTRGAGGVEDGAAAGDTL